MSSIGNGGVFGFSKHGGYSAINSAVTNSSRYSCFLATIIFGGPSGSRSSSTPANGYHGTLSGIGAYTSIEGFYFMFGRGGGVAGGASYLQLLMHESSTIRLPLIIKGQHDPPVGGM